MSRISDLMVRQGDVDAQRHLTRGQAWGNVAVGVSQILPGARRRQQEQDDRAAVARVRDSQLRTDALQQENIRGQMDARHNATMDEQATRDLATTTHAVNTWLSDVAAAGADPESQKAAYLAGRQQLIAAGRLTEQDAPAVFPGQSWIKSRMMLTLPAVERFKQLFPDAVPAKTREVKVRNADGSESIQIVEDTPGQSFTSAAPKVTDFEWVTRGGRPMQIPKGTAQPGDAPYQPPSQGQPREASYLTLVGPDGSQQRVQDGPAANALMAQGWKQYDAVAIRQQTGGSDAEAIDTAQEIQRIATALRDSPGFSGAFGVVSSRMPTLRQGTADAEVLLNSLRSLLTLENTGKLKGVLSNADMELLRQASTTLAAQMSEPAAKAELNRLITVIGKVAAGGSPAPAPTPQPAPTPARGAGPGPARVYYDENGRPVSR